MKPAERAWLDDAFGAWEKMRAKHLKLAAAPRPFVTVFNDRCVFTLSSHRGATWAGSVHRGVMQLPDGSTISPAVTSFAVPGESGRPTFFVMSLPSIWAAAKVQSDLGPHTLPTIVFLHEYAHTRQAYFVTPALAELTKRHGLSSDINDNTLQDKFAANPSYRTAFERERDLLFAAAAEIDVRKAKLMARDALVMLRARRMQWFTGMDSYWGSLDNVFLTMEGIGQWTAYKWLLTESGLGLTPLQAREAVRRNRKRWSQEEGLALFLVIDRFLPGWQGEAFAHKPVLATELLMRAVRTSKRDNRLK